MIDQKLLAKLPKKYQPVIEELYFGLDPFATTKPNRFFFELKKGYYLKSGKCTARTFTELLNLLRNELKSGAGVESVKDTRGGKRAGAGRNKGNKKQYQVWCNKEEYNYLLECLKNRRNQKEKLWKEALSKYNELVNMMGYSTCHIVDATKHIVVCGEDGEQETFEISEMVDSAECYLAWYYDDSTSYYEMKEDDPKAWTSETGKWKRFIKKYK